MYKKRWLFILTSYDLLEFLLINNNIFQKSWTSTILFYFFYPLPINVDKWNKQDIFASPFTARYKLSDSYGSLMWIYDEKHHQNPNKEFFHIYIFFIPTLMPEPQQTSYLPNFDLTNMTWNQYKVGLNLLNHNIEKL